MFPAYYFYRRALREARGATSLREDCEKLGKPLACRRPFLLPLLPRHDAAATAAAAACPQWTLVVIPGCGHRDRPVATKKKSSSRDDRLARGGARLAGDVSSFQAPGLPASAPDPFRVSVAPTTAAAAPPYPAAAAAAAVSAAAESAAIGSANVAASAADSDDISNDSSYCEAINERPAGNKGKTPFV